jgi:hypothetical protein
MWPVIISTCQSATAPLIASCTCPASRRWSCWPHHACWRGSAWRCACDRSLPRRTPPPQILAQNRWRQWHIPVKSGSPRCHMVGQGAHTCSFLSGLCLQILTQGPGLLDYDTPGVGPAGQSSQSSQSMGGGGGQTLGKNMMIQLSNQLFQYKRAGRGGSLDIAHRAANGVPWGLSCGRRRGGREQGVVAHRDAGPRRAVLAPAPCVQPAITAPRHQQQLRPLRPAPAQRLFGPRPAWSHPAFAQHLLRR